MALFYGSVQGFLHFHRSLRWCFISCRLCSAVLDMNNTNSELMNSGKLLASVGQRHLINHQENFTPTLAWYSDHSKYINSSPASLVCIYTTRGSQENTPGFCWRHLINHQENFTPTLAWYSDHSKHINSRPASLVCIYTTRGSQENTPGFRWRHLINHQENFTLILAWGSDHSKYINSCPASLIWIYTTKVSQDENLNSSHLWH